MIKIYDELYDNVIDSKYVTAKTNYKFAIEVLVPLINRFEQQRLSLRPQFYEKLEEDIIKGCIMPPLTLAIKLDVDIEIENIENFINENISEGFVLDGIQRLNTLRRIGLENLDSERPLYLNILICNSMDKLLYRMITLNNGQKPMSARHQVEILATNLYKFDDLNLELQTEKEQSKKRINGAFKKSDIITAYLAFITNSINIDNQKIIESKLDELVTSKIIDSDITERKQEFSSIVNLISELNNNDEVKKWFKVSNNLVGFSAGISKSFDDIANIDENDFLQSILRFEEAFSAIDVSRVKLGLVRRKSVKYFIENYHRSSNLSVISLTDEISQVI